MKDLPRVFANKIDKDISNNRNMAYNNLSEEHISPTSVREKIDDIFKSDKKIYSIDCLIRFENSEKKYTIIGKTDNNLVTKNERLIPIKDIYDIELA